MAPKAGSSTEERTDTKATSPRAVSVSMLKGGVGKSTLAINITRELAEQHPGDVLLIDLDPNGHTTVNLGFDDAYRADTNLGDVLLDGDDGRASPAEIIQTTDFGFDILPSSNTLESVENDLKNAFQGSARVKKHVVDPLLGDEYEYVVTDSPAYPGHLNNNSLAASQNLIIPIPPGAESVGGFRRTKSRLIDQIREYMDVNVLALVPNMLGGRLDQQTKDRVLLERLNSKPSLAKRLPPFARISESEFEAIDDGEVTPPVPGIRNRDAFSNGLEARKPLRDFDPNNDQLRHLETLADVVSYGGINELPARVREESAKSIWRD